MPPGTGTRLLFDRELAKAGIAGEKINGYEKEVGGHLDAGLEIHRKNADAAPGIRSAAGLLDLDFIPLRWERYDLLITRERFFDQGVQLFIGMLHEKIFSDTARDLQGYDLSFSGKMVYPQE